MFERSERQAAREKRSANLKKFLADEFDSEISSSTQAVRSITAASKAERVVNF